MVKLKKPKRWFKVIAPQLFNASQLGQIRGSSPEDLKGRIVEMSLGEIWGDASKHHFKLYFRVESADQERAYTSYKGHELSWEYISSLSKAGTSKIYLNQELMTKDGAKIRIKLICFSSHRLTTAQQSSIRSLISEELSRRASESSLDQLLMSIFKGEMGSDLQQISKRIAPIRRLEIYKTEL